MLHEHAVPLAELALASLHREYPNKVAHVLNDDRDALPPRRLTPLFYGCFDWHSAVHTHWALVRLLRFAPAPAFAARAERALERSFTESNVAGELSYLTAPNREGFERPYGLAWLLLLGAELAEWSDPRAERWHRTLEPLVELAESRLCEWVERLPYPIRSGEHSQSAFALGLMIDTAPQAERLRERALELHAADRDAAVHLEPSGNDFLSASLATADLLRRALAPVEFAAWLDGFFPTFRTDGWLEPVPCPDRSDGKLVHLVGLLLSRAWMLEGIAAGLPIGDARAPAFEQLADRHRALGLRLVDPEHYEGAHWLGSFAVYLLSRRGIPRPRGP